jgi:hypothetical protein
MSKNRKYPEAMEFAQMILGMSRSQPDMEDSEDEDPENRGELLPEQLTFSEFDDDSKEEIRNIIEEDIYDFIFHASRLPEEKDKRSILNFIHKNLYFGFDRKLILNDELHDLFDSILKEVVEDFEKDEDEDL